MQNISLKLSVTPLLYGLARLSYRYRKFSYVVCQINAHKCELSFIAIDESERKIMYYSTKGLQHVIDGNISPDLY